MKLATGKRNVATNYAVIVSSSWLKEQYKQVELGITRRTLGGAHVPPTKLFPRLAVNKTILKPRMAAVTGAQYLTWNFPEVIKFRVAVHTISEKAIRFWHPDCNPDQAHKLISSSMSQHLSSRNISSKSMHTFLSNPADRQTNK